MGTALKLWNRKDNIDERLGIGSNPNIINQHVWGSVESSMVPPAFPPKAVSITTNIGVEGTADVRL
jgi:hypothetical protein